MADFVNHGEHEYSGGCHCGAVRFRFFGPEKLDVLECNCSICAMTGYLHLTVPHAAFTLLTSADALTDYRFGTGTAAHLFCKVCGVKSFYQPRSHPDCFSVNLRCIDAGAEHIGQIERFDGRHWEQAAARLSQGGTRAADSTVCRVTLLMPPETQRPPRRRPLRQPDETNLSAGAP